MKRKFFVFGSIIIFFVLIIFFLQNTYKKINIGNNIDNNKTSSEIVNTILNMKSYSAKLNVKIISNKNEHNYILEQKNIAGKKYRQEVIEPSNIQGTIINYDGTNLKIENTKLNLSKIFENYPYLAENQLLLETFVEDYKNDEQSSVIDNMEEIILDTKSKINNKYNTYKTLIIDKKTGKPTKLEIKDITQNVLVYILYNEIEINSLQETEQLV